MKFNFLDKLGLGTFLGGAFFTSVSNVLSIILLFLSLITTLINLFLKLHYALKDGKITHDEREEISSCFNELMEEISALQSNEIKKDEELSTQQNTAPPIDE